MQGTVLKLGVLKSEEKETFIHKTTLQPVNDNASGYNKENSKQMVINPNEVLSNAGFGAEFNAGSVELISIPAIRCRFRRFRYNFTKNKSSLTRNLQSHGVIISR